jgi:hypothetical protein
MALHLVAYRLKNDRSYLERYESLVKAINSLSGQSRWDEATALAAVLYDGTSDQLLAHLQSNSTVYRNGDDLLVTMQIELKDRAAIGAEKIGVLDFLAKFAKGPTLGGLFALGASARAKAGNVLGS